MYTVRFDEHWQWYELTTVWSMGYRSFWGGYKFNFDWKVLIMELLNDKQREEWVCLQASFRRKDLAECLSWAISLFLFSYSYRISAVSFLQFFVCLLFDHRARHQTHGYWYSISTFPVFFLFCQFLSSATATEQPKSEHNIKVSRFFLSITF